MEPHSSSRKAPLGEQAGTQQLAGAGAFVALKVRFVLGWIVPATVEAQYCEPSSA